MGAKDNKLKHATLDGTNERLKWVWREPDNPFYLLDKELARFERMYRAGLIKSCIITALIVALLVFGKCF